MLFSRSMENETHNPFSARPRTAVLGLYSDKLALHSAVVLQSG